MVIKKYEITNNLQGLDSIRGILAVVVCIAHAWQIFLLPLDGNIATWENLFPVAARLAVIWFFCISGYVIALSVKRNIIRFGEFNGIEYFLSRTFRIMPPLIAVSILIYFLAEIAIIFGVDQLPHDVSSARSIYLVDIKTQILAIKTFCADGNLSGGLNGPLWSLQYEIQLYVLIGLVSLFNRRNWFIRLFALGAIFVYFNFAFSLRSLGGALTLQYLWYLFFYWVLLAYLFSIKNLQKNLFSLQFPASLFQFGYLWHMASMNSLLTWMKSRT